VEPGSSGRLLVTSLANTAMPMIRYDTGDIATAVDGPCPCGRTLPSFGEVLGRHIQFAGTPLETRPRLNGLLAVLSAMPNELFANMRQYQIRQTLERDFEIRVVAVGARHPGFEAALQEKWAALNAELGADRNLSVVEVDAIDPTPSGKHMDFVSDFQDLDTDYT
jgi:phenylacetate-CoA ligase